MFHTENARLLSKSAVFALWTYASLVVGGHGKANLLLDAVPALCPRCAETPPWIALSPLVCKAVLPDMLTSRQA